MRLHLLRFVLMVTLLLPWHIYTLLERDVAALSALEQKWESAHQRHLDLLVDQQADDQLMYDTGVCAYKVEDYEHAITYFDHVTCSESASDQLKHDAHYNCGNAHALRSELKKAAQEYEQALLYDPDDQDAKDNLEIVKKMQENNGDSDGSDSGGDDQSDDQGDGENSDDQSSPDSSSADQDESNQNNQDQSEQPDSQDPNSEQESPEQEQESDTEQSDQQDQQQQDQEDEQDAEQDPADQKQSDEINQDNQQQNAPDQSRADESQSDQRDEQSGAEQEADAAEQEQSGDRGSQKDEGANQDSMDSEDENGFFCQPEDDIPDWMAQLLDQQDQEDAQMNRDFALQQMQAGADREKAHCW